MLATLLDTLSSLDYLFSSPLVLLGVAFQLWMLIDAIRRREWIWVFLIFIFSVFSAILYFFMVFRQAGPATRGFELPGAFDRKRIKELQAQIHHLDKAHHHLQLGDVYFHQGKLAKAEASYRAAMERDSNDIDTRAHLGQCLLRLKRPEEARPLLEAVCQEDPRHDYGHSCMAFAETLAQLGDPENAIELWNHVLSRNSHARAHVQLAELLLAQGDRAKAKQHVTEVLSDLQHAPAFQRRRDRIWIRRARRLASQLK